jgi:hypothetical protein
MRENVSPLAGKPTEPSMLVNVPRLVTAFFAAPDHRQRPISRGHEGRFDRNQCIAGLARKRLNKATLLSTIEWLKGPKRA